MWEKYTDSRTTLGSGDQIEDHPGTHWGSQLFVEVYGALFFFQSLLPAFPFLEADIKEKIVAAALEAALHIDSRSTELHDIDITWYMCCVRYVSLAVAWHEQLKETCDLKTCSPQEEISIFDFGLLEGNDPAAAALVLATDITNVLFWGH